MCHSTRILSQTVNGTLQYCSCEMYHLSFGQIYLELSRHELKSFGRFIREIDVGYWDRVGCNCHLKRRIPIPTQQANLCLMFTRQELEELRTLIRESEDSHKPSLLRVDQIDYVSVMN